VAHGNAAAIDGTLPALVAAAMAEDGSLLRLRRA
jgi:hypothetical protein